MLEWQSELSQETEPTQAHKASKEISTKFKMRAEHHISLTHNSNKSYDLKTNAKFKHQCINSFLFPTVNKSSQFSSLKGFSSG